MMEIKGVNPLQSGNMPVAKNNAAGGGEDFGEMLMDVLREVNESQLKSRDAQNDLMAGRKVDLQDVMITMERASTAMQLTMSVRNKLLEAYQEIQRMQI